MPFCSDAVTFESHTVPAQKGIRLLRPADAPHLPMDPGSADADDANVGTAPGEPGVVTLTPAGSRCEGGGRADGSGGREQRDIHRGDGQSGAGLRSLRRHGPHLRAGVVAHVRGRRLAALRKRAGGLSSAAETFGGVLLLGLEILVAADLIRTVAVAPTVENVAVLGLIVLIRTFLSFSLEIEVEGVPPWRRALASGASRVAQAASRAREGTVDDT